VHPHPTHLIVYLGNKEGDDVEQDVPIRPEGIGRRVLPSLETTPINDVMQLQQRKRRGEGQLSTLR
jgi:hypothetical protein